MELTADSTVITGGAATDGDVNAHAILKATTVIEIAANAVLTGNYGVLIRAENRDNKATAIARGTNRALFGDTDIAANATLNLQANVTGAEGAIIIAGPGTDTFGPAGEYALLVEANSYGGETSATPHAARGAIDWGENYIASVRNYTDTISWDSDVFVHAGATPLLIIDEKRQYRASRECHGRYRRRRNHRARYRARPVRPCALRYLCADGCDDRYTVHRREQRHVLPARHLLLGHHREPVGKKTSSSATSTSRPILRKKGT
ncbi:hypothetical protein QW131_31970 [Roseibium salinum]|nr:hypothetical protein [Roseibium salinum]